MTEVTPGPIRQPTVTAEAAAQTGFSQEHLNRTINTGPKGVLVGSTTTEQTRQPVEATLTSSTEDAAVAVAEPQSLAAPAESASALVLGSLPEDKSVDPGVFLELLTRRSRMQWMAEHTLQEIKQLDEQIKAHTTGLGAVASIGRMLDIRSLGRTELAQLRSERARRVNALNGVHREYNELISRLEASADVRDRAMAHDFQIAYSQMAIDAMEHAKDGPTKYKKALNSERADLQKKLAARAQLRDGEGHEIPNQFMAGMRSVIETGGIKITREQAGRFQSEPILVAQEIINAEVAKGPEHIKDFIVNLRGSGKYTPEQVTEIHKAMLDISTAPRESMLKFILFLGLGVSVAVVYGAHTAEGQPKR